MSTIIMNNTAIANEILRDVIGTVGTPSFIKTFVSAYSRATNKRIFTLRQWGILKEIFRDNEKEWDAIFEALNVSRILFPESQHGTKYYDIFTVYCDHRYDHYHYGFEGLVVKEN